MDNLYCGSVKDISYPASQGRSYGAGMLQIFLTQHHRGELVEPVGYVTDISYNYHSGELVELVC